MYSEELKLLRKKKGISQKELAKKTALSISYIQQLENGTKTNPSIEALTKISKALDDDKGILVQSTKSTSDVLNHLFKVFDNFDTQDMASIHPLNKNKIVEYFRCIGISIPGLGDLLPESDETLYIMLHSEEFKTCIDLLYCKYKDAKIKKHIDHQKDSDK